MSSSTKTSIRFHLFCSVLPSQETLAALNSPIQPVGRLGDFIGMSIGALLKNQEQWTMVAILGWGTQMRQLVFDNFLESAKEINTHALPWNIEGLSLKGSNAIYQCGFPLCYPTDDTDSRVYNEASLAARYNETMNVLSRVSEKFIDEASSRDKQVFFCVASGNQPEIAEATLQSLMKNMAAKGL